MNFPVAEHLGAPAGHQNLGDAPNERADNIVAGQPAVTVRKLVVAAFVCAARGNDERRVRDHKVELLPRHGFQQRALSKADACFKILRVEFQGRSVQQQVKTGEGEGARRNIGGRHVVCVGEQVEGLNTAAGSHVKGTRHGGALGNLRQG